MDTNNYHFVETMQKKILTSDKTRESFFISVRSSYTLSASLAPILIKSPKIMGLSSNFSGLTS